MKTLLILLGCLAFALAQQTGEKGQKGEAGIPGSPGTPGVCSGCSGGGVSNQNLLVLCNFGICILQGLDSKSPIPKLLFC